MGGSNKRLLVFALLLFVLAFSLPAMPAAARSDGRQGAVSITLHELDDPGPERPGGGGQASTGSGGSVRPDDPTLVQVLPPEVPAADILGPLPVTGGGLRVALAGLLLMAGTAMLAGGARLLCKRIE